MSDVVLGDLCSLIVDSEHKTAPKDPEGAHPLVRTTDLGRARANLSDAQRVNSSTYELWTRRARPRPGDLILAREAPVGGVVQIPQRVEPVLGQRTVLLRPDPEAVDGRFLMYRLASDDLQARMAEMSTGSTVPHLNMKDIRSFPVPSLPSKLAQRRIAAVLSAFDDLVEINERRIELLEDLARSLYREWFVHFRFPGHELEEDRSKEALSMPTGWSSSSLAHVAAITMGQSPRSEFYNDVGLGLPFHQGVSDFGSLLPRHTKFCTVDMRMAEPLDVLCSVRAPVGRLNIADRPLGIGRGLSAIRRTDGAQAFLLMQLRQALGEVDSMGGGTIYKAISKAQLTDLPITEPDPELVKAFEELAGPMLHLRIQLMWRNRELAATRDLLLPRLVTGQLDISDIDLGVLTPVDAE